MTHRIIHVLAIALLMPMTGCWQVIEVEDDGSTPDTNIDTVDDTALDTVPDPTEDPGIDSVADTIADPVEDTLPDTSEPQCNDGLDNDGDDLIDMDDSDCENPDDTIEGSEVGECTSDNHCTGGWAECDYSTNTCYPPPMGAPCMSCESRADCGDGIEDEDNPDVDWCLMAGPGGGTCTKDCTDDWTCPRGFYCSGLDEPPGMCVPIADCDVMETLGTMCESWWDCGWGGGTECVDGTCTYECEAERECPSTTTCSEGFCLPL